jgi:hypothetical protein
VSRKVGRVVTRSDSRGERGRGHLVVERVDGWVVAFLPIMQWRRMDGFVVRRRVEFLGIGRRLTRGREAGCMRRSLDLLRLRVGRRGCKMVALLRIAEIFYINDFWLEWLALNNGTCTRGTHLSILW